MPEFVVWIATTLAKEYRIKVESADDMWLHMATWDVADPGGGFAITGAWLVDQAYALLRMRGKH
jgi:hypothetical protein